MTRLSNILALSLLAIALLACGGSETNGEEHTHDDHTHENGDHEQSDTATAPTETENTPQLPADYPQATVDGTMTLFIDALGNGEYQLATDLCDQTSIEVQDAFSKRVENFTFPHSNANVKEDELAFVRNMFSQIFRDAQWTIVTQDENEATVRLTLTDGRSSDLTLLYQDEAWFVFPYEGFLDWGEQAIGGIMQEQQGGDSPIELPTDAPAEGG